MICWPSFKTNLNLGIKGLTYQNRGFRAIPFKFGQLKYTIVCVMLEGKIGSMVSYLKKISFTTII